MSGDIEVLPIADDIEMKIEAAGLAFIAELQALIKVQPNQEAQVISTFATQTIVKALFNTFLRPDDTAPDVGLDIFTGIGTGLGNLLVQTFQGDLSGVHKTLRVMVTSAMLTATHLSAEAMADAPRKDH